MIKLVSLSICSCLAAALLGCGGGGMQDIPQSLSIVSPAPPDGMVGIAYGGTKGFNFAATGGARPYYWSWTTATSLPPGLTLSANTGAVSGTPQTAAIYSFKVSVRDSSSNQTSLDYTIVVDAAPLTVISSNPPDAVLGAPYGGPSGFLLSASGGVAPYTWNWKPIEGSSIPPGLTLSSDTGMIAGTATATGIYDFTVTLSDAQSPPAGLDVNYVITVNQGAELTITSGALPSGRVGVPYGGAHNFQGRSFTGFPLSATGGNRPYSWRGVSLPPGLRIHSILISGGSVRCCTYILIVDGVPTTPGTYNVVITVTDSAAPPGRASANYTVEIQP